MWNYKDNNYSFSMSKGYVYADIKHNNIVIDCIYVKNILNKKDFITACKSWIDNRK